MTFKQLPLLVFFFIANHCLSQNEPDPSATADVFKITVINPGISFEKSIARKQTLYAQLFMNLSGEFQTEEDGYGSTTNTTAKFYFDPAWTLQYRFYYNAKRRDEKGKRTAMNSSNYFAVIYEMVLSKRRFNADQYAEENRRPINTLGVAWGMQRNFKKRFSLDLQIGFGAEFGKATMPLTYNEIGTKQFAQPKLILQLNLGFWLNKQQEEYE